MNVLVHAGDFVQPSAEDGNALGVQLPPHVREQAEQKVWSRLGELALRKQDEPELVVGVLGCLAERDGPALLKAAQLPTRKDRVWEVELAPLTRMDAWKVPQIKVGETVGVLGFTFTGEKGDAVLRAEYLFVGGQAYGLRSSPA